MSKNIWFVSDTHFGHANIIKFCRPEFGDAGETQCNDMNEVMIERWNARVKPGDIVYHGGDFMWKYPNTVEDEATFAKRISGRLNGTVRMFLGNHDNAKLLLHHGIVESIDLWGVFKKEKFVFTHIPISTAQVRQGFVNVHGHTHNNAEGEPHHLNICVEHTGYAPVSYEDMMAKVKGQNFEMMKAACEGTNDERVMREQS